MCVEAKALSQQHDNGWIASECVSTALLISFFVNINSITWNRQLWIHPTFSITSSSANLGELVSLARHSLPKPFPNLQSTQQLHQSTSLTSPTATPAPVMTIDLTTYQLFTPLQIDQWLVLKNRVVMGPLTRARSDPKTRQASELNQIYYEQRAGAGLIIAEATAVSEQGYGWYGSPALYTEDHARAWKKVVDRVHAKGGKMFVQLWHMGRQAHSSFNSKHELVAPSPIGLTSGRLRNVDGEHVPYETPRALETKEIPEIVESFKKSAALAKRAGFDGVEIHAANGYLIDEFLQEVTNQRTDKYGGSFENRYRLLDEIITAMKQVLPSKRIGVRLSPNGSFGGMGSESNYDMFLYVFDQLRQHDLAYVSVLDGVGYGFHTVHDKCRRVTAHDVKKTFRGVVLANNSYTRDIAEGAVRSGSADMVGFGRWHLSNPDLAARFANDWPLNKDAKYEDYWDPSKGASGYTTFPAYEST